MGREVAQFDRTGWIDLSTFNFGLSNTSDITYAAICKPYEWPEETGILGVECGDWVRTGLFLSRGSSGGKYAVEFSIGRESTDRWAYVGNMKDKWVHMVGTLNGDVKNFYVNNENVFRRTDSTNLSFSVGYDIIIGATYSGTWNPAPGRKLNGCVCSVGVWDRALTVDEVDYLYNDGLGCVY